MEDYVGNICFRSLTSEYLQAALDVQRKAFYPYESVSIATGVLHSQGAMAELDELSKWAAKDGVSLIAIDQKTNTVVSVAFNKLQVPTDPFFENYARSCKYGPSQGLVDFMKKADEAWNVFEKCKVDCVLEVMFLATLPEFSKREIGLKLCKMSVEVGRSLYKGINVKQSITGSELCLEPVPKVIAALFTSPASQKLGRKLGWNIGARISYDNFCYNGKTFASVLGNDIPDTTLEYLRIDD